MNETSLANTIRWHLDYYPQIEKAAGRPEIPGIYDRAHLENLREKRLYFLSGMAEIMGGERNDRAQEIISRICSIHKQYLGEIDYEGNLNGRARFYIAFKMAHIIDDLDGHKQLAAYILDGEPVDLDELLPYCEEEK